MTRPLVTLTTDFGLADPSVGICKGVILAIAPDAILVDVSHGVARHAVAEGAALLAAALPYFPVGVHVSVVDPGVGTSRRPVAIRTSRGDVLVGPDNGLLVAAAEALGGGVACHELANEAYRLSPVSRTFHGRDIFAPAAGHLAAGLPIERLGPAVDPATLVRLDLPAPKVSPGKLEAVVMSIDSFGSAQLLAGPSDLEAALGSLESGTPLRVRLLGHDAEETTATWRRTYGEAAEGELLLLVDSYGKLLLAVNRGSATERHGLAPGVRLEISRA